MRSLALCLCSVALAAAATTPQPTFYKDALPVLQKNCQTCHRPGEAAPMAFLNYDETRPWAKAIKTAVVTKKMPPWYRRSALRQVFQRPVAGPGGHGHAGRLGGQRSQSRQS